MNGPHAVVVIVTLAVVCGGGVVGMLLVDGGWDAVFFAFAALPLAAGGWRCFSMRDLGHDTRRERRGAHPRAHGETRSRESIALRGKGSAPASTRVPE